MIHAWIWGSLALNSCNPIEVHICCFGLEEPGNYIHLRCFCAIVSLGWQRDATRSGMYRYWCRTCLQTTWSLILGHISLMIWLSQSVLKLFSHEPLASNPMICLWSKERVWRSRHSQSVEWSYLTDGCWWCPCLNMVLPPSVRDFLGMYHLMMKFGLAKYWSTLDATTVSFVLFLYACREIIAVYIYI